MKKGTLIGLAALLLAAAALCAAFWHIDRQERAEREALEAQRREASALEQERDRLLARREQVKWEYTHGLPCRGTEQILFIELDEKLYEKVWPQMQRSGIPGVLGLSEEEFPGEPGKISREELEELLQSGWSLCLVCRDSSRFTDWDREISERLDAAGIPKPETVFFAPGEYSVDLDREILGCGYTGAVHHGEERRRRDAGEGEAALWRSEADIWNYDGIKYTVDDLAAKGGQCCFTVCFSPGVDSYSADSFQNMLDYVAALSESGSLVVTDFINARLIQDEDERIAGPVLLKWKQEDTRIQAEIEELNRQIQRLYSRWNGE